MRSDWEDAGRGDWEVVEGRMMGMLGGGGLGSKVAGAGGVSDLVG